LPTLDRKGIIKQIKKYVREKNKIPTIKRFIKFAETSTTTIYKYFDSFNVAIKAAGHKPVNTKSARRTPKKDLVYNIPEFCKYCLFKTACVYDYEVEECPFYEEGWANEKGGWSND